jgi:pimeloyl-ACP methyl ester carboxylesterase
VIPALAKHYSVIALDLLSHGESDRTAPEKFAYDMPAMADLVAEAASALALPKFHLWGHSMGGGVALTLAARHPARIERLLLEDASVYPPPIPLTGRLVLAPGIGRFLYMKVLSRRDVKSYFATAFRDPALNTDEMIDYIWERFNRPGGRAGCYAALQAISKLADNTGDPGRVEAKTLIVWGDEDRIIPLAHGRRLQKLIPGARLEVIPACGHSPHEERPEEILRVALPFFAGEAALPRGAEAGGG